MSYKWMHTVPLMDYTYGIYKEVWGVKHGSYTVWHPGRGAINVEFPLLSEVDFNQKKAALLKNNVDGIRAKAEGDIDECEACMYEAYDLEVTLFLGGHQVEYPTQPEQSA